MNVLSLFDGMSCGQIALRELGIPVENYFASEIDRHAIAQTQLNFPDTTQLPRHDSTRKCDRRESQRPPEDRPPHRRKSVSRVQLRRKAIELRRPTLLVIFRVRPHFERDKRNQS